MSPDIFGRTCKTGTSFFLTVHFQPPAMSNPPNTNLAIPVPATYRRSWAQREKLQILLELCSEWDEDSEKMCKNATAKFIERWGTLMPVTVSPAVGVRIPDPDITTIPEGPLHEAEMKRRCQFELTHLLHY